MSVPYIIYNGVDSRDVGVIVEKLPDFHRAQRRIVEKAVPGRSGMLVQDDGAYELNTTTLRINCNGVDLRTVYAWLRGEGWLISSDEPDYKCYVYMYNGIEDQRFRVAGECYDTLAINLRAEPYLRLVEEPTIDLSAAVVFQGQGHDDAQPTITVYGSGSGQLMVNDVTVYIDDMEDNLTLDCEAGIATTAVTDAATQETTVQWAGEQVSLDEGEWPYLSPESGLNEVNWTGSITRVVIQPNWRYL